MKYENIKNEVIQDAESRKTRVAEYITTSESSLKNKSTETRWNQYKAGTITKETAEQLAIKRATKAIDKETAEQLAKLERIAAAPSLEFISISVDWRRSTTWGKNPSAEIRTNTGNYYGSASGCGYDKESAAIAKALNACDSILKVIYDYKEKQLIEGKTDTSRTACSGRDNREIIGYGAGYAAMPYFEGGVGASCFWSIFKKCGYMVRENHSKYSDFYSVEKEVA
ncbi:hypothetical protein LJC58_06870 [Lachnospiraceae bacterium OttesenSCG-928-D06]|nr:hypothetical protein [Lachnospiraceae bacterium OttesenSCG-928-D06]